MAVSPAVLSNYPVLAGHWSSVSNALTGIAQGGDDFVSGYYTLTQDIRRQHVSDVVTALESFPERKAAAELAEQEDSADVEIELTHDNADHEIKFSGREGFATYSLKKGRISELFHYVNIGDRPVDVELERPHLATHVNYTDGIAGDVTFEIELLPRAAMSQLSAAVMALVGQEFDEYGHSIVLGWQAFVAGAPQTRFELPRAYHQLVKALVVYDKETIEVLQRGFQKKQPGSIDWRDHMSDAQGEDGQYAKGSDFQFRARAYDDSVDLTFASRRSPEAIRRFAVFFKAVLETLRQ